MIKQSNHYVISLVLLISVLLAAASYFLPVPTDAISETAARWRMVFTIAMVTSIGGGALLFLYGLSTFKTDLRVSYRWLAASLLLLAVALLQWPFIVLFDAQSSPWVLSGAVALPFIVSAVFMYKGMRHFATLLQIKTRIISWSMVTASVASFTILSGLMAYIFIRTIAPADISNQIFLYTATIAWSAGFSVFTLLLAFKVREAIGVFYQQPMNWLVVALGSLCFGAFHEYLTSLFVSDNNWYFYTGVISWPFIITGILLIIAGYMFNDRRISLPANPVTEEGVKLDHAYLDSVANIAQLASQPAAIAPVLNSYNQSSAIIQAGGSLTDADRIQLLNTYKQLEDYLVMSDPLKSFTKDQLRMALSPVFRSKVESIF